MKSFQPSDNISKYFTYSEVLALPSWARLGNASDGLNDDVLARLQFLAQKMDAVRTYFGKPIHVHVCWRPVKYNAQIGGAKNSAHIAGVNAQGLPLKPGEMEAAIDFDVEGISCDNAKAMILKDNKLEEWGMRMENNGHGASWVHLDTRQPLPGHARYFVP